jgi:nucleotide-binding universal stress UspA family protein
MLRSIIVHLTGEDADTPRIAAAAALARGKEAKITGLFVNPLPDMPTGALGRGCSAGYLQAVADAVDEHAASSQAHLGGFDAAWEREEGETAEVLVRRARTADLLVTGAVEAEIVLETGGPVLLAPAEVRLAVGQRPLVAWDGSAQASRALRDALPILAASQKASVVSVGRSEIAAAGLAAALAWLAAHGVRAEALTVDGSGPGRIILEKATEIGADLIVMGAYGRSLLGERLFGGTTRHIVEREALPVLLSH